MAQDVNEILAAAKKTVADSEQKFPDRPAAPATKPSYTQAHAERKAPSIGDELKAKGEMVQKAREALK